MGGEIVSAIIFSGEMVRAILDGSKTQTRRVITGVKRIGPVTSVCASTTPGYDVSMRDIRMGLNDLRLNDLVTRCPYGQPGDRLWVREGFCFVADGVFGVRPGVRYKADGAIIWRDSLPDGVTVYNADKLEIHKWRPSIHMPRWASRISLEITDVCVQRVQEISEDDAAAEGVRLTERCAFPDTDCDTCDTRKKCFAILWDSINAKRGYGWEVNPWVWAITFKAVKP